MTTLKNTVAAISACAATLAIATSANAAPGAGFGLTGSVAKSMALQLDERSPIIKVQARGNGEGRRAGKGKRNGGGKKAAGKKAGGKKAAKAPKAATKRTVVKQRNIAKTNKRKLTNKQKQKRLVKNILRAAGVFPKRRHAHRGLPRRYVCHAVARTRGGSGRNIGIKGIARGGNSCRKAMRKCRQKLSYRKASGRNPYAACVIR
ncbi:MAG: hypothetical protein AAFR75_05025 [Pseudomonadota bacterium]